MRLVLGSSVEAASTVLATFLGGLAIGSFLGAKLSTTRRPLRLYAVAEFVVAATALLVPLWLIAYRAWYPTLYAWAADDPTTLAVFRLLMAVLAMAPPAIAMGTTLPLVTRVVVTDMSRFAWGTGLLYALNTFGAMTGAFVAGFYLPIWMGMHGSIFLAASINVAVGIVAWYLAAGSSFDTAVPETAASAPTVTSDAAAATTPRLRVAWAVLLLAGLSGFGSLALEVVYFRLLSYHTEGSVYSFSLMLVFVLAFLALAAVWVARNLDRQNAWRFLAWTQLAAVVVLMITPLVYRSMPYFAGYEQDDTFGERMVRYAITSAAILGPSMLLIGVVLPCTWKIAATDLARSGRAVGLLTGINTLSAVVGSMVTGFVLLPRYGLGLTCMAVTCVYGGIAILVMLFGFRGVGRLLGCAACLAMLVGWFVLGGWRIQTLRLQQGEKLLSFHDGADATVAVIQRPDGHRILKVNHDYTLGSSVGADREVRQGRLPLMLHPDPQRVAFIGVATGMTVSSAMDFPVQRVAAVELLPGVARVLPLFSKWTQSVEKDRRVEIVVEDGRNFLAGTEEQFDVIISDLFVPWHAGTGDLYSLQHFETARKRLAPGGIFAQCLPGYQLSVEELRSVTASLIKVFPNTVLWRNDYNISYPILCLTGFRDELRLDAEAVRQHTQRLRNTAGTPTKFLHDPAGLPLLYVCGPSDLAQWCEGATLNTDNYPFIEFNSPKSFFQHKQKELRPVHEFLAGIRSLSWPFDEQLGDKPVQELFQIVDLVIAAQKAFHENNFEREFQLVLELAKTAGEAPSVIGYVMNVASRYRSRQMQQRSLELLTTLVEFPDPPVSVLLALAGEHRFAGNDDQAIVLLEEVVAQSPQHSAARKVLVGLLERASQHEKVEPHLRELIQAIPDDPFLRLDLARSLHLQEKTEAASTAMDQFRTAWDGTNSKAVWRYLRAKGLGPYVDRMQPLQGPPPSVEPEPAERNQETEDVEGADAESESGEAKQPSVKPDADQGDPP